MGKDQPPPGSPERLVRGGSHEVGVRHRAGMKTGADETCDVGHVDHEVRGDLLGDLPEAGKIDDARISAGSRNDQFGAVLARQSRNLVEVDLFGVFPDAVRHDVIEFAREAYRAAVREMTSLAKIHAKNGIAGLEDGEEYGHIGLGTGMRLHVRIFRVEEFLGSFLRQSFGHVHKLTAAVISLSGVTFRVFVRQD